MRRYVNKVLKGTTVFLYTVLLLSLTTVDSSGQTFNFNTTEASAILHGEDIHTHGFPDTLTTWCNDWDFITNTPTWRDTMLLKSNISFVKFYVDNHSLITKYMAWVGYSYHLAFHVYGFTNPADTTYAVINSDTLTINYNNSADNIPYQDLNLKKYNNFYKLMVVVDAIYADSAGTIVPALLGDSTLRNFNIEGSILTQHYDKREYGISATTTQPVITADPHPESNYLDLSWSFASGTLTPVNYQLEWTYVDDYSVALDGTETPISPSDLHYNFAFNNTRVWLEDNKYRIPLVYPRGYIVYRVRAVRPDSVLFKYPIYGTWTITNDYDKVGALFSGYYHVFQPYMSDRLNWQYTASFAEGGKYKNVASFYDGLLKNRQSITRFNSNMRKLIATNNVYDYEGRLSIKTLPAPIDVSSFTYQYGVSLNSATGLPYRAADFDTGSLRYSVISPLYKYALANIYYSAFNPDTTLVHQKFVADAGGYPLVQTIFESGYNDRVSAQGGAGAALQIGDSNYIANAYVGASQPILNSLFGANVGFNDFYSMTVNRDPNQQYSMVVKDYHGKQMVSALIGSGPSSATHALNTVLVLNPKYLSQDMLTPLSSQVVDSTTGSRSANVDFFNEVVSTDSMHYHYTFAPYQACPGQYISVKANYSALITDMYGDAVVSQEKIIGENKADTSSALIKYNSDTIGFNAYVGAYHVSKRLTISPWDIEEAVDSFFNIASCFYTQPYFIKKSVDSTIFPCAAMPGEPGSPAHDSDDCSRLRWEMMKQLFPNAVYGHYSTPDGLLVGSDNSIYTIIGCPIDTYTYVRCYNPYAVLGGDSSVIVASQHTLGIVDYRCFCTSMYIPDTCGIDTVFTTKVTITALDLYDSTRSIYIPFVPAAGGMQGGYRVESNWNLGVISGNIYSGGVPVGTITQHAGGGHDTTIITMPLSVNGNLFFADVHANALTATGDSFLFSFSGLMSPPHIDSMRRYSPAWVVDSTAVVSTSSLCHYRYQDTCLVPDLPNNITIGGITYSGLRTMSADSFNMIYAEALAAGNYIIPAALLPLHPQYCALKNCFSDTFRTQVLAIPDWRAADGLNRLYLDSLIAHDPLRPLMASSGLFPDAADSLRTFPGGTIRLDSFIFMAAYCACSDSVMAQECYRSMFNYEIIHHQLINDKVKKFYFNYIANAYFTNRQRFVDSILYSGGNTCSHCADSRMTIDPAGAVFPIPVHVDSSVVLFPGDAGSSWLTTLMTDSLQAVYDSSMIAYHQTDSAFAAGAIDTIIARLSNCISGSAVAEATIRGELQSIYASGGAPMGEFSFAQILDVFHNAGVATSDICNPYVFNFTPMGATAPDNNCMAPSFYASMGAFLSDHIIDDILHSPGSSYPGYLLDTTTNMAEIQIARALGNIQKVDITATYGGYALAYELDITPSSGGTDMVKIFLRAPGCLDYFSTVATGDYVVRTDCISTIPSAAVGVGLVNQYSFVASIVPTGGGGCTMLGWMDKVHTMVPENTGTRCIPCTTLRELYTQFTDTLLRYNIKGTDHPYYHTMLANFLNGKLRQQYTSSDYETFVQSCALADSMLIPLYAGYATFKFPTSAYTETLISTLNAVDPDYSFDNAYRDSVDVGGSPVITVTIDLNTVPVAQLWQYKKALDAYAASTGGIISYVINRPSATLATTGQIGYIYTDPSFPFSPADSALVDPATNITIAGPYQKSLWLGGQYVMRDFYEVIQTGATPYDVSRAVYNITAYLYNHDIPGAVFTPQYQSTIDADYFKPEKQAYLAYTYGFQSLPDYEVLDKVQTGNLIATIPAYAPYNAVYANSTRPGLFTNLYLWNAGMNTPYYDTLQKIINLVSPSGRIFDTVRSVSVAVPAGELNTYICADRSYWFRYFTTGDTLFNVYLSFPEYVPGYLRHTYKVVGQVIPMPGDSLNRRFAINTVRAGSTDTLMLYGLTSFVIGHSIELDNMLLRKAPLADNGGADTFDNCERQELYSAIRAGVVNYNNYIDSVKRKVAGDFQAYIVKAVGESLIIGYQVAEQQFTLYNYDRAGNLSFTVPPAGVVPITDSLVNDVDTARINNTPASSPMPTYNKMNSYAYTSLNQVDEQVTINAGKTRFMYDAAGRLRFTQNAKQALKGDYTYNIYDDQSRIIQTGEGRFGCPYFDPYLSGTTTGLPACSHAYPIAPSLWLVSPDPDTIFHTDRLPDSAMVYFIDSFDRRDVVMTIYDTVANQLGVVTGFDAQQNLRKRVSCVKYFTHLPALERVFEDYDHATHYSYDEQGNVQTLTQDYPRLTVAHRRYIRVDYDYDVISGKVNMLSYNRGMADQFYQRYSYDADNRITDVQTSNDGYIWSREAKYTYYQHGPLARIDLGELRVQGLDYAYTIQGWLKALNTDTLNSNMDMGGDAAPGSITGIDAVAHTIDYFNKDYRSITGREVQHTADPIRSLYNGNIARQTVAMDTFIKLNKQYVYDQMNRILTADYAVVDPATGDLTGITDFHSNYAYDPDGNIQSLLRYGNNTGTGAVMMDSLTYDYPSIHHDKLANVHDHATDTYTNDLRWDTASVTRYHYDAIGNMTADLVSGQDSIIWNLYNKVTETRNHADTNGLVFEYDGAGNRIAKHYLKPLAGGGQVSKDEYYVHDAQGNVLATYRGQTKTAATIPATISYAKFALAEHNIYGSSRLGIKQYYATEVGGEIDFAAGTYDTFRLYAHQPWYSLEYQDVIKTDSVNLYGNSFTDMHFAKHVTGQRQYEVTDHLGNVLATVSDKRAGLTFGPPPDPLAGTGGGYTGGGAGTLTGVFAPGDLVEISTWKPIIISLHDYYPFGEYMPGRYRSDTSSNCVTTTINEVYPDVGNINIPVADLVPTMTTFNAPILNTIGGGAALQMNGPGPFAFSSLPASISNSGLYIPTGTDHVNININAITGQHTFQLTDDATGMVIGSTTDPGTGTSAIAVVTINIATTPHSNTFTYTILDDFNTGSVEYTGITIPYDTISAHNVVTTVCNTDFYRYGYNGKQKDNEWAGLGNHLDFGDRMYEARVGRWLSLDVNSAKYPAISPYAFSLNSPLLFNDPDGKSAVVTVQKDPDGTGKIQISAIVYVTGTGATQDAVNRANEVSAKLPKGTYVNKKSDGTEETYEVTYSVKFQKVDSEPPKLLDGENVININKGSQVPLEADGSNYTKDDGTIASGAPNYASGGDQSNGFTMSSKSLGLAMVHEGFHFLGLSDRYTNVKTDGGKKSVSHKGYENDIMSTGANFYSSFQKSPTISQTHTDNYGKYSVGQGKGTFVVEQMVDRDTKGDLTPPSAPK